MASEVKLKCHLHDPIKVHTSSLHGQGADSASDPDDKGKYEVNGNYAVNPELAAEAPQGKTDAVCSCQDISETMEDTVSGLPAAVEGKASQDEKGRVTFSLSKEEEEEEESNHADCQGASAEVGGWETVKNKGRGGGHCSRSKDTSEKGHGHTTFVIDEQPMSPHLFERSLSCSTVEKSKTKDLLTQMKEMLSGHSPKEAPHGEQPDADPPLSVATEGDVLGGDTAGSCSDNDDKCLADTDKTVTSESEAEHNDVSKSSEDETVAEISQPATASKKALCLPRPFRFKERRLKDSEKVTEKPPLGPSLGRGGKGKVPPTRQSWLLRLFESKLFDMSIAISYLFNSKEPGVQTYLGNRMFSFAEEETDFYLPQLLNMYSHMHDVAEAIHPYLLHRCRSSVEFSVSAAWILDAFSADCLKPNWKNSQGVKLKNMILGEELRPMASSKAVGNLLSPTGLGPLPPALSTSPPSGAKKTHHRSRSEATGKEAGGEVESLALPVHAVLWKELSGSLEGTQPLWFSGRNSAVLGKELIGSLEGTRPQRFSGRNSLVLWKELSGSLEGTQRFSAVLWKELSLFGSLEGTQQFSGRNSAVLWKELNGSLEGTQRFSGRNSTVLWKELAVLWKELSGSLEGTQRFSGRNSASLVLWKELSGSLEGTQRFSGRNSMVLWKELSGSLEETQRFSGRNSRFSGRNSAVLWKELTVFWKELTVLWKELGLSGSLEGAQPQRFYGRNSASAVLWKELGLSNSLEGAQPQRFYGRNSASVVLWKELSGSLEGTQWFSGRNSVVLWKELSGSLEGTRPQRLPLPPT
ncbi:hypothetical protein ACOMHN_043701 [Nucella lapillus]